MFNLVRVKLGGDLMAIRAGVIPSTFAISLFSIVSLSPAYAASRENCNQQGDPNLQILGCTQIVQDTKEPDQIRVDAFVKRGLAYYVLHNNDQAIADFNSAIEIDPKYEPAYLNRAFPFRAKGQYDRAIADSTKAIELNPKDAQPYNIRGDTYEKKGDDERAIADFTKAIEIDTHDVYGFGNRCRIFARNKSYDQAIADCSEALRRAPYPQAFRSRGIAYLGQAKYAPAIVDFTKAIELYPKYAESYGYRGIANEKLGRREAAIADFRKSLSLDSTIQDSKDGLLRLGAVP
jgi:tetratricopeptide (TPR) repeat protein